MAFGGARAARAQRRGARGADRARHRSHSSALSALRERLVRFRRASAALPVQQDLQRAERYAAVGLAPQGTLAVVRASLAKGETVKASRRAARGGEHGVPLASPVSQRFQGDRGSGRDLRIAGRARAGWDARHGIRASRCRRPERNDSARCCPGLSPTVALPPPLRRRGVSHGALNRSMGERVRGDLHVQTVNSRHSGLPASSPWHRHPLSRQLPELVPPRWPRPRRQRPGLPRRRRDEVTHTIH